MKNQKLYDRRVGSVPFLWCLLFGAFYFMFKGVWFHVFIYILLSILTLGLSMLIYPFFARSIVFKSMSKRGLI